MELTAQVFYACAGLALVLVVILLVLPAPRRPFGLPPALALALAGLAAAVALGVGIAMPGWLLQESKATDDRLPVYAGVVGYQFAMKPDERGWSTLAFDLNGGGKTRSGDSPAVPELLLPGVASEGPEPRAGATGDVGHWRDAEQAARELDRLVSDEAALWVARTRAVVGDADEVIGRLNELRDEGAAGVTVSQLVGDGTPDALIRDMQGVLEALA